jgi:hypothetical protein
MNYLDRLSKSEGNINKSTIGAYPQAELLPLVDKCRLPVKRSRTEAIMVGVVPR